MALYELTIKEVKASGTTKFTAPLVETSEQISPENRELLEYQRKLGNALKRLTDFSKFNGGVVHQGVGEGYFGLESNGWSSKGITPMGKFEVRLVE